PELAPGRQRGRDLLIAAGAGPARLVGLGLEGVELGQHAEQQRDPDRDRDGGHRQPDECLAPAAEGEPEAEPEHQVAAFAACFADVAVADSGPRSSETSPSRTITTRSAYAA